MICRGKGSWEITRDGDLGRRGGAGRKNSWDGGARRERSRLGLIGPGPRAPSPPGATSLPPWSTAGHRGLTSWWPRAQDPAGRKNSIWASTPVIPPGKRLKSCPGGLRGPSFWAPLHHFQPQHTALHPDFLGPNHTLGLGCCAAASHSGRLSDGPLGQRRMSLRTSDPHGQPVCSQQVG